jgi:uncharacterized protein with HEPN domain
MLQCIDNIVADTSEGREVFMSNRMVRDAVMRNLQVMTESSKRVSDAMKSRAPEVPWPDLAGFRNVAVHDYLHIDYDVVWTFVERVPELRAPIEKLFMSLA